MRLPIVVHVFLVRHQMVLLARRTNTGFEDGNYGPVGGHLEPEESLLECAIRECQEEIGVTLIPTAVRIVGVTHYTSPTGNGIDFFLQATEWQGEPIPLAECDQLSWALPEDLPSNTIPFVRRALEKHMQSRRWFDEIGFSYPNPEEFVGTYEREQTKGS